MLCFDSPCIMLAWNLWSKLFFVFFDFFNLTFPFLILGLLWLLTEFPLLATTLVDGDVEMLANVWHLLRIARRNSLCLCAFSALNNFRASASNSSLLIRFRNQFLSPSKYSFSAFPLPLFKAEINFRLAELNSMVAVIFLKKIPAKIYEFKFLMKIFPPKIINLNF